MSEIFIEDRHLKMLREILKDHPDAYIFGSRVSGKHQKFSDLDLCFIRADKISRSEMSKLRDAFEESNLPFKVDILDYHAASEEFQKIIDKNKVPFPY